MLRGLGMAFALVSMTAGFSAVVATISLLHEATVIFQDALRQAKP